MKARQLTELEISHLEALVKSPAMEALKALLDIYRDQCFSVLTTSKDPAVLFETQGRITGANVIENLPSLYLAERAKREVKKKKAE